MKTPFEVLAEVVSATSSLQKLHILELWQADIQGDKEFESAANKAAISRENEMEAARAQWLKATERVKGLEEQLGIRDAEITDLQRRLENQKSFIHGFASCLDGLPIHLIPGSLIDGARDAGSIRTIVVHLIDEIVRLRSKVAEAQAACAEMRQALTCHANLTITGGIVIPGPDRNKCLSSTCGQGWRSPEEYAKLEAACAEMREVLSEVAHGPESAWNAWLFKRDKALSSTCGQGWKSPGEYAKALRAKNKALNLAMDRLSEYADIDTQNRDGWAMQEIDRALKL